MSGMEAGVIERDKQSRAISVAIAFLANGVESATTLANLKGNMCAGEVSNLGCDAVFAIESALTALKATR